MGAIDCQEGSVNTIQYVICLVEIYVFVLLKFK
jgi:hypothetical protein